ncbi:MAG: hypothetical protein K6E51_01230 [Treponema sp.]|nr:hypothetical protein [Treponema sp.]
MPLKLLGTIIILVLVTIFAGLNLDNKCNINLLFRTFENVPVFYSMFISFLVGMIVSLLFCLFRPKSKNTADSNGTAVKDKKLNKKKQKGTIVDPDVVMPDQSERVSR